MIIQYFIYQYLPQKLNYYDLNPLLIYFNYNYLYGCLMKPHYYLILFNQLKYQIHSMSIYFYYLYYQFVIKQYYFHQYLNGFYYLYYQFIIQKYYFNLLLFQIHFIIFQHLINQQIFKKDQLYFQQYYLIKYSIQYYFLQDLNQNFIVINYVNLDQIKCQFVI